MKEMAPTLLRNPIVFMGQQQIEDQCNVYQDILARKTSR